MVLPEVVPEVVPVVVPVVLVPDVVPEVVPVVVVPDVDPEVVPVVEVPDAPSVPVVAQAPRKLREAQSAAPSSKEILVRFILGEIKVSR